MYEKLEELSRLNNAMDKIIADVDRCNKQLESEYKQLEEMRLNEFMDAMHELAGYAKNLTLGELRTDIVFEKKRYDYDCDKVLIFKFNKDGNFVISTNTYIHGVCLYASKFSEYEEIKADWDYWNIETFEYGWVRTYKKEGKKFIAAHANEILGTVQKMIEDGFGKKIKAKADKACKEQSRLIDDIERVKKQTSTGGVTVAAEYTTLYVTVDDDEASFEVPTDWLKQRVEADYNMSISDFMEEYTSNESVEVLLAAFIDGLITEDKMNHVLWGWWD